MAEILCKTCMSSRGLAQGKENLHDPASTLAQEMLVLGLNVESFIIVHEVIAFLKTSQYVISPIDILSLPRWLTYTILV
ncbi:hypothetical protein FKM82_010472 [Ascaphus truei]